MAINGDNLAEFRTRNSLRQGELAEPLGVPRSFISMIEHGKSKLPKKQFEKLISISITKGWDIEPLLPGYARLKKVLSFLADNNLCNPISDLTLENLRLAEIDVSPEIVDSITAVAPSINGEWLLTGDGNMFRDTQETELSELHRKLDLVLAELREARAEIAQLKTMVREAALLNK